MNREPGMRKAAFTLIYPGMSRAMWYTSADAAQAAAVNLSSLNRGLSIKVLRAVHMVRCDGQHGAEVIDYEQEQPTCDH